jgi:hypothetical protein
MRRVIGENQKLTAKVSSQLFKADVQTFDQIFWIFAFDS